jgi:hypothetical protein
MGDFSFLFLSFLVISYVFQAGAGQAGQGELPRAACGLSEVGVDGEQDWTVHNLVMI